MRLEVLPLVQGYRSLGKVVAIETDVTNGINRTARGAGLVALGRSITEDTVQKLYENYVVSVASSRSPTTSVSRRRRISFARRARAACTLRSCT